MKPVGVIILIVVFVFLGYEIYSLIKSIKNKNLKKGDKKDGSSCDDRNTNSSSNH